MAALNKLHGNLAFTDAAFSVEQNAFAVDLDENAVTGYALCKGDTQSVGNSRHKLGGGLRRSVNRDIILLCKVDNALIHKHIPGKNDDCRPVREKFLHRWKHICTQTF